MKYPSDKYINHLAESETGRDVALEKGVFGGPKWNRLEIQKTVWVEGEGHSQDSKEALACGQTAAP